MLSLPCLAFCLIGLDFDLIGLDKRVNSLESRVAILERKAGVDVSTATTTQPPRATTTEIVFYTRDNCIYCPRIKATLDSIGYAYDTVIDETGTVPRVSFRGTTLTGPTPAEVVDLLVTSRVLGSAEPTAARPAKQLVVREAAGPVRVVRGSGPSWTWPGNLRNHLQGAHGYSASQLAGLSQGELIALHNNAHNGVQSAGSGEMSGLQFSDGFSSGGSCPGGNCPSGSAGSGRPRIRLFGGLFRGRR